MLRSELMGHRDSKSEGEREKKCDKKADDSRFGNSYANEMEIKFKSDSN